jgi:DNA polymerase-3 subunit alpha
VAKYDHPRLEPILKGTYGVFVYQEQVMAAANELAGFSMAKADELRRAMGKKIVEEMAKKRDEFVVGCAKSNKIPAKVAEKVFATMEKFAGYGFNKSHSAAYALVAYQCAYLKGNYPAEFMAATMTSEMSDSARIVTLIEECRRLKIEILAPDVNRSQWKFTIEDGRIRIGLGAVRNVGQGAVEAMLAARAEGGPFRDLFDLASRVPAGAFNRRVLESLVASGACDGFGAERGRLFAGAAQALDHASALHRERASGQSSLFGDDSSAAVAVSAPPLPDVPEWTSRERSAREKEILGFYFSEHPLQQLRADLEKVATHGIGTALDLGDGAEVRVVGIVGEIKQITTKAGKLMAMVVLEDLTGRVECTVFPEAFEAARAALVTDAIVVASGRVEVRDDRGPKLLLSEVKPWEQGREQFRPVLHIELKAEDLTEERLADLDQVLAAHPGESEVYLHIVKPDHSRLAMRARRRRVADGDALIAGIKQRVPGCRVRWGKGAP